MSRRCIKILLLLFLVTQNIAAQLPGLLRNTGYQNLPAPEIRQNFNQPAASNYPGPSNNVLNNVLTNSNAQTLQAALPKLQFINGQIGELLNLVSNMNSRQLAGNNPGQNSLMNNKLQVPSCATGLVANSPYMPDNGIFPSRRLSNVPNNIVSTSNNLPDCPNQFQYSLPVNNNLPAQKPPRINSLTLAGQPFNNGLPFNVLPANAEFNNANNFPLNNFITYNDIECTGLKIPRSLPTNEVTENGYVTSNSLTENNNILPESWQSYNEAANIVANNILENSIGNGLIDNSYLPINQPSPQYIPSNVNEASCMANNVHQNNFLNNGFTDNSNLLINQEVPNYFPPNSNDAQASFMANIFPQNNFVGNGFTGSTVLPTNHPVPNYIPSSNTFASKDAYAANLPLNIVDFSKNLPLDNMNDLNNMEQIISNTKPISNNEWHHQLIQKCQNNDLTIANWLGNNVAQPVGNNLLEFSKPLSLGDFGSLPIFSGLPIIGITETVSLINPENVNQIPQLVY